MESATLNLANEILSHLLPFANFGDKSLELTQINTIHFEKIHNCVAQNKKIQFVLPAFPAKSRNNQKTYSHLPDLGELEALKRINQMAKNIHEIYPHGVEVVICSDGRVFSDLVGVTEEDVSEYRLAIKNIARDFDLDCLSFFDLEDIYPAQYSYDDMRSALEIDHATSIEDLKLRVKMEQDTVSLFNGIHRFIKEDYLVIKPELSKNQITKLSKAIAYQVILRSNAWSSLVEEQFPRAVRLSIHPQALCSTKFPIQLIPCSESWGTPWHRVAVMKKGKIELMRKVDVDKLGGILKTFSEKYVYFELGAVS
jgi:pyoverdine/dityrosine biosynthesis protein Dit1